MAAIETVYTATLTNTDVDNDGLNPASDAQNTEVHIYLRFDGVTFTPNDLYDALDAQWGTVRTDKVPARNTYSFVISA